MANTSLNYATLDFDSVKDNLKDYLRSQPIFKDYDFEASNINVLLDVLAYNTQLNGYYLNMIGNEMFLDSALMRDSVVSHAKELNYLPRSFRSSVATVDLYLQISSTASTEDDVPSTVLIPRGTPFSGVSENKNFTFVTDRNIEASTANVERTYDDGGQLTSITSTYSVSDVNLYEGDYTSDSYVVSYDNPSRYIITNRTVDINSLIVTVIEDNGSTTQAYSRADSLFGLTSASKVFFIQAAENQTYEVVFGDGVVGRKPKDRSVIILQYRKSNGELPNGIRNFTSAGLINGAIVTNVVTTSPAAGGSISESIDSIRFNAPRAFTTQERVVTSRDYETILKTNFSEINDVSAYGGEEAYPPEYGKVYVAVDLKTTDQLPPSRRDVYYKFIRSRSPLAIDPVFVSADYTYVSVDTTVKYNVNETNLSVSDIEALVKTAIQNFNETTINGFNKTLLYSRLTSAIDNSILAIVSNDTEVTAIKTLYPTTSYSNNYDVDFGISLKDDVGTLGLSHDATISSVIESSLFIYRGVECFLEDDGEGAIRIMAANQDKHSLLQTIGSVNYESGFVKLENFGPDFVSGDKLNIFAKTKEKDINSRRNTILKIRDEDINVNVIQVRV